MTMNPHLAHTRLPPIIVNMHDDVQSERDLVCFPGQYPTQTVNWLLDRETLFSALPVYFGDDDKDEEAVAVIRERDGIPVVVGARQDVPTALVRVSSPDAVRRWLQMLQKAALANYRTRAFRPGWLQS